MLGVMSKFAMPVARTRLQRYRDQPQSVTVKPKSARKPFTSAFDWSNVNRLSWDCPENRGISKMLRAGKAPVTGFERPHIEPALRSERRISLRTANSDLAGHRIGDERCSAILVRDGTVARTKTFILVPADVADQVKPIAEEALSRSKAGKVGWIIATEGLAALGADLYAIETILEDEVDDARQSRPNRKRRTNRQ